LTAKNVRFPDASSARPHRSAARAPVGVHTVIRVSARSVADDVGTSSAPVRIVSDASTPVGVQVLSPAMWTLIVTSALRGAVCSTVTGMVRLELVNGCSAVSLIGAPIRTPVAVVVAVTVTFSAAMIPLLARLSRSVPDSPGSR
jgi:hypothetical protein